MSPGKPYSLLGGAFLNCSLSERESKLSRHRLKPMEREVLIFRDDDPRCVDLEASGYILVAESWGARLRLDIDDDMAIYVDAVNGVLSDQVCIEELSADYADDLYELELVNNPDYPYTPATSRVMPTIEDIRALWVQENRIFGATSSGVLIGALSTSKRGTLVELDFASILRVYRGKGIGKALAATAILEWVELGIYLFGTGGASVNEASLGTVKSLGFSVEERWRSYQPPL